MCEKVLRSEGCACRGVARSRMHVCGQYYRFCESRRDRGCVGDEASRTLCLGVKDMPAGVWQEVECMKVSV